MRLEGRALAHERLATMHVVVSHTGYLPGLLATVAQLDRKQASCGSAVVGQVGCRWAYSSKTAPAWRPSLDDRAHRGLAGWL